MAAQMQQNFHGHMNHQMMQPQPVQMPPTESMLDELNTLIEQSFSPDNQTQ